MKFSEYWMCIILIKNIKFIKKKYFYTLHTLHFSVFGLRNCAYKAIGRPYIFLVNVSY